ncbi:MAG: EamA family transporter [Planctomycetota bacterium]|jgi:drug/metabolite transporter (DMT)-like permease|nr:EamA family transporter [Planctomycetota bacterium]
MWFALICVCLWSFAGYGSARCARNWGTARANRFRLGLATALLLALCLPRGVIPMVPELGWYIGAGVLHLGLADIALFAAYRLMGPRLGVLVCLTCAVPVAVLAEWLWLGNTPSATALALSGAILVAVVFAMAPAERLRLGDRSVRLGLLFGLLSGVGQGLSQVVQAHGADQMRALEISVDPFVGSLCRALGGLLVLLAVWPITRLRRNADVAASYATSTERLGRQAGKQVWPWLLLSAIFGPILGIGALTLAIEHASSPSLVQAVVASLPVVMIPVAWILDGDRPSLRSALAGLCAVGCVIALALLDA